MKKYYDFDHSVRDMAEDFYEAYNRCIEGKNGRFDEYGRYCEKCVNVPAIVNGAFAIELYLKSMTNKHGHGIKELFSSINSDDQTMIRGEVESKLGNRWTFEEGLDIIDNSFVFWRYIHEKEDFGAGFNVTLLVLPAFLKAVRKCSIAKKR